jgi:HK97 family phage major capsid protein
MNPDTLRAEMQEIGEKIRQVMSKDKPEQADYDHLKDLTASMQTRRDQLATIEAATSIDAEMSAPANPRAKGGELREEPKVSLGKYLQAVAVMGSADSVKYMDRAEAHAILDVRNAASGLNESVPSEGGFLVGTQQSTMLEQRAYDEGKLVKLCEHIPISGPYNGLEFSYVDEVSRADGSRQGGVRVYRTNEAPASLTSAKPAFGKANLKLENLTGLCYVTEEELQDAATLEALIVSMFGREFGFKQDDEFLNGTGAGQMLGVLNSGCLVSVAKETGQAAKTVSFENIVNMYARLWSGSSMASTRWIMNRQLVPQIMALSIKVGTAGFPLFIPGNSLTGTPNGTLLGVPIEFAEQAATPGTVGDIILADMKQYRIIEKGGLQSASSIHVKFDTTGETAFRFRMRNNGQPLWKSTLTPYKDATTSQTVSPFVALAVRA